MTYDYYATNGTWLQKVVAEKDKSKHLVEWRQRFTAPDVQTFQAFNFVPLPADAIYLPPHSFILSIKFHLRKPYISKDDVDFYAVDNPLRKDWVFKIPVVASTSWKGALRHTLWQLGYEDEHNAIIRLFGQVLDQVENEEEPALTNTVGQSGRLHFYATFFDQGEINLEVINPHKRDDGVGTQPILFESVAAGAEGTLTITYVPFGPGSENNEQQRLHLANDILVLAQGVSALLATYGFGAKTSSGYGTVVSRRASGELALHASLPVDEALSAPPEEPLDLPGYLETESRLIPDLCLEDGSLKTEEEYRALIESRNQTYNKKRRQLYTKAKSWWSREREQAVMEPEPEPAPSPPFEIRSFTSLATLIELAEDMAKQLQAGDDQ